MKLILYTDGGARGNPGPAGAGGVIYDTDKKVVKKFAQFLGKATNNQAEYQALVLGLELAKKLSASEVDCYLDSLLVVEQMNQKWKIKNKELSVLFVKVWNLAQSFEKVNFYHIPREKNEEADKLVNEIIDKNTL
ncbi:MAG: ribonuclease HI family protein [Patescibacteria group bacterium]|nr:ribonuclease HI family protein [Patescibacteria group bacterium]MDD5164204.1 ribonuclease HI family protein [Patescibacteria group bacterium]MDD5534622.1 ribonuclease HI family protein [Patescibacteria group bacterium]